MQANTRSLAVTGCFLPVLVACLVLGPCCTALPAPVDKSKLPPPVSRQVDYLRDIQPIFTRSCYGCHGPDKQKGGFRLDLKTAALAGGEDGPAIVPGQSAESPLIHFVSGLVEDRVMPAKGERLTAAQIGLLRAWVDQGAPWPDGLVAAKATDKKDFWTFKPAVPPTVPKVKNPRWPRNAIDNFILARLEKQNLAPSPEADRVTLIRRLSFDLAGLPPTPDEVSRFVSDRSPNAYDKLVDRLLNSPRYGERWGRHWLDVVHYGESHGYDKDKPRLNAWPYRDYVIRAFNQDTPYTRFVEEQLAGDVLFPEDPNGVIATGFIAAGPWDYVGHVELPESKTDGLIARYNDRDDMVMTTMSTFLSLTVHCARCHDHKFDPITQADYYSLQAVFAGVGRADRWYDPDRKTFTRRRNALAEKAELLAQQKALNGIIAKVTSPEIERLDTRLKKGKEARAALPDPAKDSPSNGYHSAIEAQADVEKWVQIDLGKPQTIDQIRLIPARPTDFPDTPGFGFPRRFRVEIAATERFTNATILADRTREDVPNAGDQPCLLPAGGQQARYVRVTATRLWERTHDYVFALAELQVFAGTNNLAPGSTVTALDSIEDGRWSRKYLVDNFDSRHALDRAPEPPGMTARRNELEAGIKTLEAERQGLVESLLDEDIKLKSARVKSRLVAIDHELEGLPKAQLVFGAADAFKPEGNFHPTDRPRPIHLLKRGDVKQPGALMVPGTVSCLPGLESRFALKNPDDEGARRAALARWITQPRNLQMRRSMVNRVWQYHFGRGIVDTPNDFGHMGALPTHPELLDWLAYWFRNHGESIKKLHRLILTSATYRQSSHGNPAFARVDADDRYLWRMNRLPLDAEAIRDSILYVSGRLDSTMGGPSVQQFFFKDDHSPTYDYSRFDADSPLSRRRSVYRFIVRSVPDPFMECLDCADPSQLAPKRDTTLTALQALALLDDPFVVAQAVHFADRVRASSPELREQIQFAYELAMNRPPRPDEADLLSAYAGKFGLANACRLILNSNEFMFVD
ncbi:MAG: DUF1553 domain-containing protein [Limisphaerales bacterium]